MENRDSPAKTWGSPYFQLYRDTLVPILPMNIAGFRDKGVPKQLQGHLNKVNGKIVTVPFYVSNFPIRLYNSTIHVR